MADPFLKIGSSGKPRRNLEYQPDVYEGLYFICEI